MFRLLGISEESRAGASFSGWNGSDDRDVVNSLWWSQKYYRSGTRNGNGYLDYTKISYALPSTNDAEDMMPNLNPVSGEIVMRDYFYRPAYLDMQVQYCLSERFQAPCRLTVSNPLLLVVCIMCIFKTLLCMLVLVVGLRLQKDDSSPLITPGDAIASFIVRPDLETKGMCTLNRSDLTKIRTHAQPALINSSPKIRQWHLSPKRRLSAGVPRHIWVLSVLLITCSLCIALAMFVQAIREQSMYAFTKSVAIRKLTFNQQMSI